MIKGLCQWVNNDTQKITDWHPGMTDEWYQEHKYICDKEKLVNLMNDYEDTVVVVGLPSNRSELWDLFDKVFLLQCKEDIFIQRLMERTSHDFGKHILEQENILGWYKDFEKKIIEEGAIPIDANKPLDVVVNNLITHIKS